MSDFGNPTLQSEDHSEDDSQSIERHGVGERHLKNGTCV